LTGTNASFVGTGDFSSGALTLTLGADNGLTTRTNLTQKIAKIVSYNYTNANNPVGMMVANNDGTDNALWIGGGSGATIAATNIQFYTAANNNTATGTARLTIASTGAATFSSSVTIQSGAIISGANYDTYVDATNANTLNFGYNANSALDGWINYKGYLGGTTQFRNTNIGNGKAGAIATFVGSTGAATFSSSAASNIIFNSTNANGGYLSFQRSGTACGYIGSGYHIATGGSNTDLALANDAGNILFVTGGSFTERMRITSEGYLGTTVTGTTVIDGDLLGLLSFVSRDSSTYSSGGITNIRSYATSTYNTGNVSGDLRFYVSNGLQNITANYLFGTEAMRITSGGYLKVSNNGIYVDAVTSPQHEFTNSNSAERTLQANAYSSSSTTAGIFFTYTPSTTTNNTFYHISSYSGGGYKFRVADSGNVTNTNNSYTGISDIKLKENIIETSPKLDNLLKIRVVNYNLIGDNLKQIGVIAQELEQIFPSMIEEHKDFKEVEVTDKEGNVTKERQSLGTYTKAVKYSVFVPMLIKAIQEQNQIITSLQDRLDKAGL
jgi:hypothetical protein